MMMRSYVQVEHQEIIFYYGPFDTINKAHKAAEKFKKNNKKNSRDESYLDFVALG